MLGALGKMVKRDYRQIGEAINDYTRGINITKEDMGTALTKMIKDQQAGRDMHKAYSNEELASLSRGQRGAIGWLAGQTKDETDLVFNNGVMHETRLGRISQMRSYANDSSDFAAAGRLAAVGVVGFSATAGAVNLIRDW